MRSDRGRALAALLLSLSLAGTTHVATAQPTAAPSPEVIAAYQQKLAAYHAAHDPYIQAAGSYWRAVAERRRARFKKRRDREEISAEDYVLTQPPVYTGPPEPVDPSRAPEELPRPTRKYVPVIADFLRAARAEFDFVPRRPRDELEYKRAYARLAADAGFSREQIVHIYAFECGGNGTYDIQAGLEYGRPGAHAITTALGYNQLLSTNSVGLLAEKGERFVHALQIKASRLSDPARAELERKIAVLRRMIAFSRTVPDRWSAHDVLGKTPKGLGIHALLLDVDVGPLMQVQKLADSLAYARRKGLDRPLTAAELEMLNLTGDGNGFDMISLPDNIRGRIPTANFFHQASYWRNRIAVRHNTVAALLAATAAKMKQEARLKGAREMAAAFVD